MNKSSPGSDARIELNLKNMGYNLKKIRELVKVPIMGVIKANAYGHGLLEIGQYLESQGIDSLMVCKLGEAMRLREAAIACPIVSYAPYSADVANELINYGIIQSVYTDEVKLLDEKARKFGKKMQINIHVDTGFGDMGIPYYEALPYIENVSQMENLHLFGISTKLTEDMEFDREQMKRFNVLCKQAEKKGIHLGIKHVGTSCTLFSLPSAYLDMVRPGIVLYGYYPNKKTQKEDTLSLKPVLQLKSCIVAVKRLRPSDSLYYHRIYKAKDYETVAIIAAGYSDGYPRNAVDKGCVLIKGKRHLIIGGISAHDIVVALPDDSQVSPGDEVTLIGSQGEESIYADEIAEWNENSDMAYSIISLLNPLLPRRIIS